MDKEIMQDKLLTKNNTTMQKECNSVVCIQLHYILLY